MSSIRIPDTVWAKLALVAADRGTTVDAMVTAAVGELLFGMDRKQRVLRLLRAGLTDREVSVESGETRSYISDTRRKFDMPANRGAA